MMYAQVLDRICAKLTRKLLRNQKPLSIEVVPNERLRMNLTGEPFGDHIDLEIPRANVGPRVGDAIQLELLSETVSPQEPRKYQLPFLTVAIPSRPKHEILYPSEIYPSHLKITMRCPFSGTIYITQESLEPLVGLCCAAYSIPPSTGPDFDEGRFYLLIISVIEGVLAKSPPASDNPADLNAWNVLRIFDGKKPFPTIDPVLV